MSIDQASTKKSRHLGGRCIADFVAVDADAGRPERRARI